MTCFVIQVRIEKGAYVPLDRFGGKKVIKKKGNSVHMYGLDRRGFQSFLFLLFIYDIAMTCFAA